MNNNQHNYLDSIKSKHYDDEKVLDVMCEAADSICDMERMEHSLIANNVNRFTTQ